MFLVPAWIARQTGVMSTDKLNALLAISNALTFMGVGVQSSEQHLRCSPVPQVS